MRDDVHGAGAYPPNLVPAVRPGDYAVLLPDEQYVRVDTFVPQPGVNILSSDEGEDITVTANSTSDKQELTPLEQPDTQLGQLRFPSLGVDLPDGIEITVDFGGRQATFYQTKNREGFLDNETGSQAGYDDDSGSPFVTDEVQSQLTEFYIYEDEVPYLTFRNTTNGDIDVADLRLAGYRFDVTEVEESAVPADKNAIPLVTERISAGRN